MVFFFFFFFFFSINTFGLIRDVLLDDKEPLPTLVSNSASASEYQAGGKFQKKTLSITDFKGKVFEQTVVPASARVFFKTKT